MRTHPAPSDIVIIPPDAAPAALVRMPDLQVIQQQPQRLVADFAWSDPTHRQQAAEHLQGLQIAVARKLTRQIPLYLNLLLELVATDVKERVCALVRHRTGKNPFCYAFPDPSALPTSPFHGEVVHRADGNYRWIYAPLTDFGGLIPPHALTALLDYEEAGLRPQAYWVADLVQIYGSPRWQHSAGRSLDPVLCAQFYRWFVGIAAWQ